jgi:ElaB/YqjD/DUF883 family membrane-anchored ribosome-binding protein
MSADSYSGSDGSSATATTRADIEATRARMGDTIEELGVRLNPSRLKQQAKDKVRDATIGRVQTMANTTVEKATSAGQRVTSVIRENPIPAALIAAGISWLVVNSRRGSSSSSSSSSDSRPPSYGSIEEQGINDNLRDKAGAAVESAQDAAQQVKEKAGSVASNIAQTTREKTDKVARTIEDNPLPLGIVAAAIGLAAGFAVPSTRKESELVGEKRDELIDKARDVVEEKKTQAKNVAKRVVNEAKSTATEAAREEGLTS